MKTVMDMAREAGFGHKDIPDIETELERFAELIAAEVGIEQHRLGYEAGQRDEREACALECNRMDWRGRSDEAIWKGEAADECATAIRARGEK